MHAGCGLPLILQQWQADVTFLIETRVVDLGDEDDLRRLEWIVRREGNGKVELSAFIRAVGLKRTILFSQRKGAFTRAPEPQR